MFSYVTYNDLVNDIRENLHKIPSDVYGVIARSRSGMLPATIISEHLNVGLVDFCTFEEKMSQKLPIDVIFGSHGKRGIRKPNTKKFLFVDDTVSSGSTMQTADEFFEKHIKENEYEFIKLCVYLEGDCHISKPDIYLKDLREFASTSYLKEVLYEWNIFGRNWINKYTLFDLDGVVCIDPPDELRGDEYIEYINNPIPLHIPIQYGDVVINIMTYRLEKYRNQTERFLQKHFSNFNLMMFPSESYTERSKIPPYIYKGEYYKNHDDFILFVESDDWQAALINEISGKPVFCVGSNKMYN